MPQHRTDKRLQIDGLAYNDFMLALTCWRGNSGLQAGNHESILLLATSIRRRIFTP
jgi:hypothetical protein